MGRTCEQAIGELMSTMHAQILRFFARHLGIPADGLVENGSGDCPALVSALPIHGSMQGTIYLGAEKRTVSEIIRRLIGDDIGDDEEPVLLRDTLNEILNVVVGNATRPLEEIGLRIRVSPPASIASPDGAAAALADTSRRRRIQTASGTMVLSFGSNGPAEGSRPVG